MLRCVRPRCGDVNRGCVAGSLGVSSCSRIALYACPLGMSTVRLSGQELKTEVSSAREYDRLGSYLPGSAERETSSPLPNTGPGRL